MERKYFPEQMKRLGFILYAVLISIYSCAQDNGSTTFAERIDEEELRDQLTILASDALEGRKTGTRGQKMAAAFIAHYFESIGLAAPAGDGYYQKVPLYQFNPGNTYVKVGEKFYRNFEDIVYYGKSASDGVVAVPLVYAGLGREADFEQVDVKGKAVLLRIENQRLYNLPEVARARAKGAEIILLWNTNSVEEYLPLVKQSRASYRDARLSLKKPSVAMASGGEFMISPAIVEDLMGLSVSELKTVAVADPSKGELKKIKPKSLEYQVEFRTDTVMTENVLGFLEGTDKKDEVLVITAHYDHIGKKETGKGDLINNGADDDASGTVTVMQVADAFAAAKAAGAGPRRSVLFMLVAGEEMGLLGSNFYTKNPVFPLDKTVANLNIDMVGRRDPLHQDGKDYLYIIGSDRLSTELHQINEDANNKFTKMLFDYTYNDEAHPSQLYYRSDHWNFAKNDVPIIFFFDGIHEDYHKPSDEADKIDFPLLTRRARHIFFTAWEIVNRENRIVNDRKKAADDAEK